MDSLTVTRLRTECRLRRLPVSGRKRNLVLRLLPFADVILDGRGNAAVSGDTESRSACPSQVAVAPPTPDQCNSQPVNQSPELEFHQQPFVPLDSFDSSGWSNFDDDDDECCMTPEESLAPNSSQFAGIVRRRRITDDVDVERAGDPLAVGGRDNRLSSIIDHVDFQVNSREKSVGDGNNHEVRQAYNV